METPDPLPSADYPPPPAEPPGRPPGRSWTIGAFVCAVVSIIVAPIVFGPLGVFLGVLGLRKGDPLGKKAAIASIVGMLIGIVLAAVVGVETEDEALALLVG